MTALLSSINTSLDILALWELGGRRGSKAMGLKETILIDWAARCSTASRAWSIPTRSGSWRPFWTGWIGGSR